MNKLPKRKSPRKEVYDYSLNGAYFITICTYNKQMILSEIIPNKAHSIPDVKLTNIGKKVEATLTNIKKQNQGFEVRNYVIMPNHIHFILFNFSDSKLSVNDVIGRFKSYTTHFR